jgi:two-component system phosphate regulon sensor histidine kinase PhoR
MRLSRLFWKLFLCYAGLVLIAAAVLVLLISNRLEPPFRQQIENRLHNSAVLLGSAVGNLIEKGDTLSLQVRVRQWGKETGTRITIVAMDGQVLADSEKADRDQVAGMDNHRDRAELAAAAADGEGSSTRISPTLGVPMLYYARRIDIDGKPVGLVRTALTTASIREEIGSIEGVIWMVALLVSLSVLVVTYWLVARILRPVATLTRAAEAIAAGEYEHHVYVPHGDELGDLADSFNRMNQQMAARMDRLRLSSQRLETVLTGMVEGVIAVDDEEHILFSNPAAGRLLQFSPEQSEGRPLIETIRNHLLRQAVVDARQSGAPQQLEVELSIPRGCVIGLTATPLPGEPSPGVLLVLHDVTELRRLESLRQDFVANVSHELKTPLSSIKAYAETLQGGAIDDKEHRLGFVQHIEDQADRLHQLILDMLSLAQIESGKEAFDITAVSVAPMLDACLRVHHETADGQQIALYREPGDESAQVLADEEGLRQILDNLIGNALKYTPEHGQVSLRWRVESDEVLIEVQDTGIGIAPDDQPRLFERFFRVDKARSRELGGTGLGLSIVKHLVQSFGGAVGVESRVGDGSTFWVRLPRAPHG